MTDPTNTLGAVALVAAFLTLLGAAALVERHRNNRRDGRQAHPAPAAAVTNPCAVCGRESVQFVRAGLDNYGFCVAHTRQAVPFDQYAADVVDEAERILRGGAA